MMGLISFFSKESNPQKKPEKNLPGKGERTTLELALGFILSRSNSL
jgi:hypothetical protein